MKYEFFIGCDISKKDFDASYYCDEPIYLGSFPNTLLGFKQMINELKVVTETPVSNWLICFENTGIYSKALLEFLISLGIDCKEENPLKIYRSKGLKRGSDDRVDSKMICNYVYEKRSSIQPTQLPDPALVKLKQLLTRRDFLVRQKQAIIISLKEQKVIMEPILYASLLSQNQELITTYKKLIKEIEIEIAKVIQQNQGLKKNDKLIQSVVGIGPIISAYILVITKNFTCFKSSRQFATYAGIAPFKHGQSGIKKGKTRVSHIANKKIKSLLSMAVYAALQSDKELQLYYARKLNAGKEKGVIINNIKNKLIHRVFATVKRQTAYVKIMNYA